MMNEKEYSDCLLKFSEDDYDRDLGMFWETHSPEGTVFTVTPPGGNRIIASPWTGTEVGCTCTDSCDLINNPKEYRDCLQKCSEKDPYDLCANALELCDKTKEATKTCYKKNVDDCCPGKIKVYDSCYKDFMYAVLKRKYCCKYDPKNPIKGDPLCTEKNSNNINVMKPCNNKVNGCINYRYK